MAKRKPKKEVLRALVLRALWSALGCDPATTKKPVNFAEPPSCYLDVASLLPEDPLAQDLLEVDLNEIAVEVRTIWSISNDDSAEYEEAFDFGDDFYYVAYTLTEQTHGRFHTAIPKQLAEPEFAKLRLHLGSADLLSMGGWQPTAVEVLDLLRPDSLRMMALALDQDGFAQHVVETMYGAPWVSGATPSVETETAKGTKILQRLWQAAVRSEPPRRSLPPGFLLLAERSQPFDQWLGQVSVHWVDTGNRLDAKEAEALRWTCLFLAQAS